MMLLNRIRVLAQQRVEKISKWDPKSKAIVAGSVVIIFLFKDSIFYRESKIYNEIIRINRITGNTQILRYDGWENTDDSVKYKFRLIPFDYYYAIPGSYNLEPKNLNLTYQSSNEDQILCILHNNNDMHLDEVEFKIQYPNGVVNSKFKLDCKAWSKCNITITPPPDMYYERITPLSRIKQLDDAKYIETIQQIQKNEEEWEQTKRNWKPPVRKSRRIPTPGFEGYEGIAVSEGPYRLFSETLDRDLKLLDEFKVLKAFGQNPNFVSIGEYIYEKRKFNNFPYSNTYKLELVSASGRRVIKSR